MRALRIAGLCCAMLAPSVGVASSQTPVPPLGPRVPVSVVLVDGREVAATTLALEGGVLVVQGRDGRMELAVELIDSCSWEGAQVLGAQVPAAMAAWAEQTREMYPSPPRPWAVRTASWVFPGAGHAMLGDWPEAAKHGVVGGVFAGTLVSLLVAGQPAALLPVAALDVVFRSVAGAQTAREARRRDPSIVVSPDVRPAVPGDK